MPVLATQCKDLADGEKYYEGQPTTIIDSVTLSGINFDTVKIPFGRGICRGVGDDQAVTLPVDGTSKFLGVAVAATFNVEWDFSRDNEDLMSYEIRQLFKYFVKGCLAVKWATAFTPTGDVFMIHTPTPATIERKGMFRIGTAANAIAVPNARALKSGVAGAVSPLLLL